MSLFLTMVFVHYRHLIFTLVKSVLGPCEDENDDIQDDDVSLGADSVQRECSESNSEVPGLVNVDFADVRAIMENAGSSLMGIGGAQ
ncbi:Meiosis-specific protein ASY1 [Camellia lanceoleosa]|nr:Meiosis-specific protein ASY1 [Camellia lanceoleosa]